MINLGILHKFINSWLVLAIILAGGCKPARSIAATEAKRSASVVNVEGTFDTESVITSICKKIVQGEFGSTAEMLNRAGKSSDPRILQLSGIVDRYRLMEDNRSQARKKAYEEQLAELAKISEKGMPVEPNGLSEAFLVIVRAKEYALGQQKEELLKMPFVEHLVAHAHTKGEELEARNEWLEAYAHCYYWLAMLYEDNKDYEEKTDELTIMATIEMALKDNACETSIDRYRGIKPEMLTRSINALHISYVSDINYREMAQKGIDRCLLLAKVLTSEGKELAYTVSKDSAAQWDRQLYLIEKRLDASITGIRKNGFIDVFGQVLELNEKTLKVPQEVIVAQFSGAALESLDPYTNLIWPWQVADFRKNMSQEFTGIGIHISKIRGVLSVASLLPGTPAYSSGLDAKDQIVAVDGEPTKDMTLTCVVSKITGPKGTPVMLTVRHEGDPEGETEDITIVRAKIVVPTIRGWQREDKPTTKVNGSDDKWGHMIDSVNKIGYMRLTGFTDTTAPDLDRQLTSLEERGMQGFILDLRDNSGGYLKTAAAVVDMFIDKGMIVKSRPRWGVENVETAHKKGTHPNYPVVILINERSASASEIVAGALQDEKYKRATLVGTRTYGKGSVQTMVPYSGGGSELKYTMAYYHLPSDQRVKNRYAMEKQGRKDWGIAPDVEVELTSAEQKTRFDMQWSNDILVKADHDMSARPVKRYSINETLEADPQLQTGLLVLQAKIIQSGKEVVLATPGDEPKEVVVVKDKNS